MKYGIMEVESGYVNYGDIIQLLGVLNIYKKMGVEPHNLVHIKRADIHNYDGEYVLLPINRFWNMARSVRFPLLSKKIIPVFLGIYSVSDQIIEQLSYYKHFGPFGCRDLDTMHHLRRCGLDAYMFGCASLCFDKRIESKEQNKTFIIDAPASLSPFIPTDIKKNCEYLTHELIHDDPYTACIKQMEMVRDNAKCVITMRIHATLPYLAMGIPVIWVNRNSDNAADSRFSGYSSLIKRYTEEEFATIDWNPSPTPAVELLKNTMIRAAHRMIKNAHDKWGELCEVSDFFERSKRQVFFEGFDSSYLSTERKLDFIHKTKPDRLLSGDNILEFITNKKLYRTNLFFYGAGGICKAALKRFYSYIQAAKSFTVVDSSMEKVGTQISAYYHDAEKSGNHGENYIVQHSSEIEKYENCDILIIICLNNYYSTSAVEIANHLINTYNLSEGKDFFFWDKLIRSMHLPLEENARRFSYLDE